VGDDGDKGYLYYIQCFIHYVIIPAQSHCEGGDSK
jgi:hypothetical protein